jgi:hypothetical protein
MRVIKHPYKVMGFNIHELVWREVCERVARPVDWESCGWACPYPGCWGSADHVWFWSTVRELNTGYPSDPAPGEVYPLYTEH